MRRLIFLPIVAMMLAGLLMAAIALPAQAHVETRQLQPLIDAVSQRLLVAGQVALSKWDSGKTVDDPKREAAVIAAQVTAGAPLGLAPDDVFRFYEAQVEANKLVQYGLLARWRFVGFAPPHRPVDLVGVIRPRLDQLDTIILQQLARDRDILGRPDCSVRLARVVVFDGFRDVIGFGQLYRTALMRAMAGFCRAY